MQSFRLISSYAVGVCSSQHERTKKRYDKEIRAKIECRGIQHNKPYNQLSIKEKKDILKVNEMKNLAAQLKARESVQPSDTKYIVPQSAEMKALVITIHSNI